MGGVAPANARRDVVFEVNANFLATSSARAAASSILSVKMHDMSAVCVLLEMF